MIDTLNIGREKVVFCAPTYKHTITPEVYRRYVKSPVSSVCPWVNGYIRKSELSLILNFCKNLECIVSEFSEGIFLILESDVDTCTDNIPYLADLISMLTLNIGSWDVVNIGGSIVPNAHSMWEHGFIEDISTPKSTNRLERKFATRLTDAQLISYDGAVKLLEVLKTFDDYCVPIDNYITNFLPKNHWFKYYWSDKFYFYQRTTSGQECSSIQNDPREMSI